MNEQNYTSCITTDDRDRQYRTETFVVGERRHWLVGSEQFLHWLARTKRQRRSRTHILRRAGESLVVAFTVAGTFQHTQHAVFVWKQQRGGLYIHQSSHLANNFANDGVWVKRANHNI